MISRSLVFSIILCLFFNCERNESTSSKFEWKTIEVTATAYNSLTYQTDSDPSITAFGDSLYSGLKYIAVSRDLLELGMKHNTPVVIEGLQGMYVVKDKMNKRWKKRIDIYMGNAIKTAKAWGKKKITIHYRVNYNSN